MNHLTSDPWIMQIDDIFFNMLVLELRYWTEIRWLSVALYYGFGSLGGDTWNFLSFHVIDNDNITAWPMRNFDPEYSVWEW